MENEFDASIIDRSFIVHEVKDLKKWKRLIQ